MILRALFAAAALAGLSAATANASPHSVTVPSNHAGIVRLPEEAATVIVGNPAIADAALYDQRTLIVSGRIFGQTNVIAMNEGGRVIYAADLSVTESDRDHVRVYRNNQQFSFVCDPDCQSIPSVGDNAEIFDRLTTQRAAQADEARAAAGAGAGGN